MNPAADAMSRLPVAEVHKLRHLGGNLEVDRVYGQRVLVRLVKAYTDYDRIKKETGIVAPNEATAEKYRPLSNMGIVIAVGDGVQGLDPGDAVFFSRYAGIEFTENKSEGSLKILEDRDVLCTMKAKEGALEEAIAVLTEEDLEEAA